MSRPILAVDIDGVISLFGFEAPPTASEVRYELVDGALHCLSLRAGERLGRLAERFDLVWASGWEDKANFYLPALLGLAELPHITFDGAARDAAGHWKLGPLEAHCRGRALAWIDDNLDDTCHRWARERPEPTLLVPTDPALGLLEAETEALLAWSREPNLRDA